MSSGLGASDGSSVTPKSDMSGPPFCMLSPSLTPQEAVIKLSNSSTKLLLPEQFRKARDPASRIAQTIFFYNYSSDGCCAAVSTLANLKDARNTDFQLIEKSITTKNVNPNSRQGFFCVPDQLYYTVQYLDLRTGNLATTETLPLGDPERCGSGGTFSLQASPLAPGFRVVYKECEDVAGIYTVNTARTLTFQISIEIWTGSKCLAYASFPPGTVNGQLLLDQQYGIFTYYYMTAEAVAIGPIQEVRPGTLVLIGPRGAYAVMEALKGYSIPSKRQATREIKADDLQGVINPPNLGSLTMN